MHKLKTLAVALIAAAATLGTGAIAAPASAIDQPDLNPIAVKGLFSAFTQMGRECGTAGVTDDCAYHPARHGGVGQRHIVWNGWTYYL